MIYEIKRMVISDKEYEMFIPKWIESFSGEIKNCWPNVAATKKAIELNIVKAINVSMGIMEIYDYFSISYPGIMHKVIDCESEQEKIFQIFELTMKEIIDYMNSAQQGDAPEPASPAR